MGALLWKIHLSQRQITGAVSTVSRCNPLACVREEVSSDLLASELVNQIVLLLSEGPLPRSRQQR